ncbi:DUF4434 domain-containing protein [Pseudomonas sp. CC6-YY-74]|uniref:DUF4434 domain-containing protein n=1 Tax=Pseudomonas sp. CC6-YY-74 TaxID=1930532 RepID=UPI0009A16052|nr:DUF4434 domain-containing protein [Pseudomonas sp. CC6-YY-74]
MTRFLLVLALALGMAQATRAETLFYQPLNSDAQLSASEWRAIWQQSREQGVDRLIVQWTRYGDEDFGGEQGWLRAALLDAQAQGLQLILGLYQDPDYFSRVAAVDQLPFYWHQLLARGLDQQRRLAVEGFAPAGWYLPAELSDRTFNDRERREEFLRQLQSLAELIKQPLHVSAYSSGQLAPVANARWLSELKARGVQVWWQDGAGLRDIPAVIRSAYASALPCEVGIVSEAFTQVNAEGQPFRAVPAAPVAYPACHPAAVFSLRYQPWGKALLRAMPL